MDLEHKNRSYTITFKLETIKYAEDTSNRAAANFIMLIENEFRNGERKKKSSKIPKTKSKYEPSRVAAERPSTLHWKMNYWITSNKEERKSKPLQRL